MQRHILFRNITGGDEHKNIHKKVTNAFSVLVSHGEGEGSAMRK